MRETIYRDDAIKAMRECFQLLARPRVTAIKAINAIPSADRPQGEWKNISEWYLPQQMCSVCGKIIDGFGSNFCPNCGADMRKGAEDEAD